MEGYERLQVYYFWVLANMIAFVLAALMADAASGFMLGNREGINHAIFIVNPLPYALINGLVFGLVLGVTESLFLWQPLGLSKRWLMISIIAWVLSSLFWALLEDVPAVDHTIMQGILAGALLGVMEWVYLRPLSPHARWWIVTRMICGISVFQLIVYGWYPIVMGIVNGLITGIVIVLFFANWPRTVMPTE